MAELIIDWNPISPENLDTLLEKVGFAWSARIQRYFDIGGPEEAKWGKTQKPQKAAILSKIQKYGSNVNISMMREFLTEHPPLLSTGELRDSFTWNVIRNGDMRSLQVGTNIEYAEAHQLGEQREIKITREMKEGIKVLLKSKGKGVEGLSFLRGMLKTDVYRFQLKKRILIMWDSFLRGEISNIFEDYIKDTNSKMKGK